MADVSIAAVALPGAEGPEQDGAAQDEAALKHAALQAGRWQRWGRGAAGQVSRAGQQAMAESLTGST